MTRPSAIDQNGLVYCPSCGSESNGPFCPVCGSAIDDPVRVARSHGELSGWWRRVGATVTDNLILLVPTTVVLWLVSMVAGSLIGVLAGFAVQGAYLVTMLVSPRGQTFGNRIVATRVCDLATGGIITRRQALWRWGFVAAYSVITLLNNPIASSIVMMIAVVDVLFPLANPLKQTLHDRVAGTLVVRQHI